VEVRRGVVAARFIPAAADLADSQFPRQANLRIHTVSGILRVRLRGIQSLVSRSLAVGESHVQSSK
jgi:hypothetical protein